MSVYFFLVATEGLMIVITVEAQCHLQVCNYKSHGLP